MDLMDSQDALDNPTMKTLKMMKKNSRIGLTDYTDSCTRSTLRLHPILRFRLTRRQQISVGRTSPFLTYHMTTFRAKTTPSQTTSDSKMFANGYKTSFVQTISP